MVFLILNLKCAYYCLAAEKCGYILLVGGNYAAISGRMQSNVLRLEIYFLLDLPA